MMGNSGALFGLLADRKHKGSDAGAAVGGAAASALPKSMPAAAAATLIGRRRAATMFAKAQAPTPSSALAQTLGRT